MDTLKRLSELCKLLEDKESKVKELTLELDKEKKALKELSQDVLPSFLSEYDLEDVKVKGKRIEIRECIEASIKDMEKAYQYLLATKDDILFKTHVILSGATQEDVGKVCNLCNQLDLHYELSAKVHPAALKSYVRQRLDEGEDIASLEEAFHVYRYPQARVR